MQNEKIFSNRRITHRFPLNIIGQLTIEFENQIYTEQVDLTDISYEGLQMVFSNNIFFTMFMKATEIEESQIVTDFQYRDKNKNYQFKLKYKWFRLFNFGEKDYYILVGFTFMEKEKFKEELLNLLTELDFENIYLGLKKEEKKLEVS